MIGFKGRSPKGKRKKKKKDYVTSNDSPNKINYKAQVNETQKNNPFGLLCVA